MPLDLVIANAGMALGVPRDADALGDYVETVFATNVQGVFNTIHPAIARMAARGQGQIAIMSSMAGYFGMPSSFGYSAAKVAVKAYGEGLRGHLEKSGVAVSVICPGFVETALTARNRFPMPFLMPADRAARRIRKGLAANRAVISFPRRLVFLVWGLSVLPTGLRLRLLTGLPKKS
jgi:short-subunit dehydrogenase